MGVFDEMAARIEKLEQENQELQAEQRYVQDLAANPNLSASQKWAMWAVRSAIHQTGRNGEQLTEVNMREIAKSIGMSPRRAGDSVRSLAETGAIARQEHTELTKDGKGHDTWRTHISLGFTLFSGRPKEIVTTSRSNHGGLRYKCERCGGENLEVYQAYICKDCGHIHQAELKKETKGRRGFVAE